MQTKIFLSSTYEKQLQKIEDFILMSTESMGAVSKFLIEHDAILQFLSENSSVAAKHPITGDQSWPFFEGRYRVFFVVKFTGNAAMLYLLDIIDNRQANLKIYPGNSLRTYSEED